MSTRSRPVTDAARGHAVLPPSDAGSTAGSAPRSRSLRSDDLDSEHGHDLPRDRLAAVSGHTVTVRLSGVLAQRLGSRRTIDLAGDGATVEDVVAEVGRLAQLDPDALRGLAVVAGGAFLRRDLPVADGDELDVLVPVAGG